MRLLRWLAVLLLVVALAAGYIAYRLSRPYAAFGEETFVEFPRGTSTSQIAGLLEKVGVIERDWEFLAARALHPRRALQAGEYHFTKPASVWEVCNRIARGDVFYYVLAVPEGHAAELSPRAARRSHPALSASG